MYDLIPIRMVTIKKTKQNKKKPQKITGVGKGGEKLEPFALLVRL